MEMQDNERRYVVTRRGIEDLAASAGMSPEVFAQRNGIAYLDEEAGQRIEDVIPDVPHQLGINAFVAQLAVDARKRGGEIGVFLNAAMSEHRFVTPGGQRVRISPDAAGWLNFEGGSQSFLLEYEKERVDEGELRAKLAVYCAYYESSEWKQQFPLEPVLLYVCAGSRAERQVFRALSGMIDDIPAFVVTDQRYRRNQSTALGLLGRIWRVPRSRDFGYAFRLDD